MIPQQPTLSHPPHNSSENAPHNSDNSPPSPQSHTIPPHAERLLLLLGFLTTLTYACFYFFPLLDPPHAVASVRVMLLLSALYLPIAYLSRDLGRGRAFWWMLGMAFFCRLLLWPHDPSLSDDAYRYLWDGRLQLHGLQPYGYPPDDPQLLGFRDLLIHPFINHPHFPTVYPPLSQVFFALAAFFQPQGFLALKLLLALGELIAILLLLRWLQQKQQPLGAIMLYLWCPLPLIEMHLDAHLDGFALPFLVAVLMAAEARRGGLVGCFLACAILIKPLPIFLAPVLFWHLRWRQALWMLLSALTTGILIALPYLTGWKAMLQQILLYARLWYFNGYLYTLLEIWLMDEAVRAILTGSALLIACLVAFLRISLTMRLLLPLAAYLLLTPTLYPWYLLWLAPWLVWTRLRFLAWWFCILPLAHLVHAFHRLGLPWEIPHALMILQALPLAFFALLDLRDARRRPT